MHHFISRAPSALALVLAATLAYFPSVAHAQLYVSTNGYGAGEVNSYNTSDTSINSNLISGSALWGLAVSGNDLFVVSGSTVGEYTTSGTVINANLITGLSVPRGIAFDGSNLYVANQGNGTIGKYTITNGSVTNAQPSFITNAGSPTGIALNGSDIYVANFFGGKIAEYDTSGATLYSSLASVDGPTFIAITGSAMYVTFWGSGKVGEYGLDGTAIKPSLITNLNGPEEIAAAGSDLFVANESTGIIGEYDTSGNPISASLITGLGTNQAGPTGIAVSLPEPATCGLFLLTSVAVLRRR